MGFWRVICKKGIILYVVARNDLEVIQLVTQEAESREVTLEIEQIELLKNRTNRGFVVHYCELINIEK